MNRRVELAVVLASGIGIGIAFGSARSAVGAAGKGVKVSTQGKAALIDVPASRESVFVAVGQRQPTTTGQPSVPLAQVMGPGRTRVCMSNLAGPLFVFEMRANLVFDRLSWNECTPQLCVDPYPNRSADLGRLINSRFAHEICGNQRDDDGDGLVDGNDPDCQC